MHTSALKLANRRSWNVHTRAVKPANLRPWNVHTIKRLLLVFLVIVWFALLFTYGLNSPDQEQVFAQLRALSIPAPRTPLPLYNDLQYVYEYHERTE